MARKMTNPRERASAVPAHGERQRTPNGEGQQTPNGEGQQTPNGEGQRAPKGEGPRASHGEGRRTPNAGGREQPKETWLQIVVTGISGLLILSIVGYLVWEGTRPFTPAEFQATVEEARAVGDRYHVRLRVTNTGGQSVASLEVVLELWEGDEVVESAAAVLDWVPERSSRDLVLIVPEDPGDYTPVVRYRGYQIP